MSNPEISPKEARQLCTKNELNLYLYSLPGKIKSLSPTRLREKILRARKLRDKHRDVARRQRREARGKLDQSRSRPVTDNDRRKRKVLLFEEAMARFQEQLAAVENAGAGSSTRKKTRKKAATAKKTTKKTTKKTAKKAARKKSAKKVTKKVGKKTARKKVAKKKARTASAVPPKNPEQKAIAKRRKKLSKKSKSAREASHWARAGRERIKGHVSARGKRSQARRDSRG